MKKSVISVLSMIIGAVAGMVTVGKFQGDKLEEIKKNSEKHLALFLMMNQWVKNRQAGKDLSAYFEKNAYKKIAIYGMSYAGETLFDELRDTGIIVAYCIDKNADLIYADVDIVSMDNKLEPVDAVVVTAISYFDQIKKDLVAKMECEIVSLEDIVYEL